MLQYYQGILENVREGKSTYNGGCVMSEDSVDLGRWRRTPREVLIAYRLVLNSP